MSSGLAKGLLFKSCWELCVIDGIWPEFSRKVLPWRQIRASYKWDRACYKVSYWQVVFLLNELFCETLHLYTLVHTIYYRYELLTSFSWIKKFGVEFLLINGNTYLSHSVTCCACVCMHECLCVCTFSYIFMAHLWNRCTNILMLMSCQKNSAANFLPVRSWPR